MRLRWLLLCGGLILAAALLTGCDPTIGLRVNTTVDGPDADPGDGVCEMTSGAGDCSLRAAVDEANSHADVSHITVESGTYTLTQAGNDDTNAAGDLDVAP